MKHQVYVISSKRHGKLPFTKEQKSSYIFCVGVTEKQKYNSAGCVNVHETGSLMDSRNFALKHAFKKNMICVQLSDDLKKVTTNKFLQPKKEVDLDVAIADLVGVFNKIDQIKLMGVPPTDNDFFAKNKISKNTFCIGDALFVKPCDIFFDTNLTLKEDYDYTLQHIRKYGCFRYQKYLFSFEHYKNDGGAEAIEMKKKSRKILGTSKKSGAIRSA